MNIDTFLLGLLVIASYANLYITLKKRKINRHNVELKEWEKLNPKKNSFSISDKKFKDWIKNTENLNR